MDQSTARLIMLLALINGILLITFGSLEYQHIQDKKDKKELCEITDQDIVFDEVIKRNILTCEFYLDPYQTWIPVADSSNISNLEQSANTTYAIGTKYRCFVEGDELKLLMNINSNDLSITMIVIGFCLAILPVFFIIVFSIAYIFDIITKKFSIQKKQSTITPV